MMAIKKISVWIWVALVYSIITACFLPYAPTGYNPVFGGLTIIVWCCCLGLRADEEPFSINKIFWTFNLVFFGFMPTIQTGLQEFPWFQHFSPATCNKANLIILASFAAYYLSNKLITGKKQSATIASFVITDSFIRHYKKAGAVVFLLCAVSIVAVYGLQHLWLRRSMMEAEIMINSTLQLVFDKVVRGSMLYYLLLSAWLYRHKKIDLTWLVAVIAICLFANFPLAIPRYLAATMYGGLLLTLLTGLIKGKSHFALMLVLLLITVFPLGGLTRHTAPEIRQLFHQPKSIMKEAFIYGEYDAYATLCRTVQYIAEKGTTSGKQLAGVLLFFVPRSIWKGKPVGSGMLIYKDHAVLGVWFRNVASPFYAEGLINFGLVGCLLFVAVFAVLANRYDLFYRSNSNTTSFSYLILFYPVAVLMSFFMLRGDLLSSFAFSAGFFLSGLLYHRVLWMLPAKEKQP